MSFIGWARVAGFGAARQTKGAVRGVLEHPRTQHKGVDAALPEVDIRHLNCAQRIVYKMLACRPGSEYELESFKEKQSLKTMSNKKQ